MGENPYVICDFLLVLVPESVTLNDLERRNGRVFCVISPSSVAFRADYVNVFQGTPIGYFRQQKCSAKNVVSGDISLMAIFALFRRGSPLFTR